MEVIKKGNLAQKAASIIGEQIIKRRFLPGERIVEVKMAQSLGVSQGTIREAFRILEERKMVKIQGREGTYVTKLTYDYVETMYDILEELYAIMVRKAIKNITSKDVEDLSKNMEDIKACMDKNDGIAFGDAMYDGISILIRMSNNELLEQTIKGLWTVKRWIEYESLVQRNKRLFDDYKTLRKTYELILNRKTDAAIKSMREKSQYQRKLTLETFYKDDANQTGKMPEKYKKMSVS